MEFGYYGRMEKVNSKFRNKNGAQYFMLDEHLKTLVNKQIERFNKEISKIVKNSHEDYLSIKSTVDELKKAVSVINKKLEIEEKLKKVSSSKNKIKEEEEFF